MLSCFPRDVSDEIWDLIESVSEGFPSYSSIYIALHIMFICVCCCCVVGLPPQSTAMVMLGR